jgi:MGT family glycosyltransferase
MDTKKFVFATMPVTGHVSPLLPLAAKLIERNHEVYWYTSSRFQSRIQACGAAFVPYRAARDIDYDNVNALFPERARLTGIAQARFDLKHLIIDMALEQLPDVRTILGEVAADAIVGDSFSLAVHFLAESLNLPHALVNVVNLGYPSRDTGPDGLALAPNSTALGRLRNRFLNWLVANVILSDVKTHFLAARAKLKLAPTVKSVFAAPFHADLYLQPTIPAFEYPRSDLPDHVHFIGALTPAAAADDPLPDWWQQLEGSRPVVLVTQGTVATNFDDLLLPAVRGLADEDVLVIGTTGNQSPDDLRTISRSGNLCLEKFIPYARLMPFVDVMVTNGGYGGVHFALTHGIPLVAAGASEDKAEICARIAWSGVGLNLKTSSPSSEQVRQAVKKVLEESRYKQKAQAMQAEFARHDAPSEAADLLEKLADRGQRIHT